MAFTYFYDITSYGGSYVVLISGQSYYVFTKKIFSKYGSFLNRLTKNK